MCQENEVLIVLIPHIVRLPVMTAENLRSIASGTDTNAEVELGWRMRFCRSPVPRAANRSLRAAPAPTLPQAGCSCPVSGPNGLRLVRRMRCCDLSLRIGSP